jgi:secreted Zn-dependent insulinase-like peptidase
LYNLTQLNLNVNLTINQTTNMILLYISCLNDPIKFNKTINKIIDMIKNSDIKDNIIISNIESYKKILKNYKKETAISYLFLHINSVFSSNEYSLDEMLNCIETITIIDVRKKLNGLLDNSSLKTYIYGNLRQDYL